MNQLVRLFALLCATFVFSCHGGGQIAPKVAAAAAQGPVVAAEKPATGWQRPFLYRITTKTGHFYVFGTIHLPDERLEQFPPQLSKAFDSSVAVYTEIPLDDALPASLIPHLVLSREQSLKSLLPGPLYENLTRAFGEQGISFAMFEQLKPWVVSMQLTLLDKLQGGGSSRPIDMVLYQRAKDAGKAVGGLETPEEQVALFDELSLGEQVVMLEQTYEQREKARINETDPLGGLLEAYVAGSDADVLRILHEETAEPSEVSAKLLQRVFTDRNESLTERIVKQVKAEPSKILFFAVGCGHVVGEDGIVTKLRAQGYKAERL